MSELGYFMAGMIMGRLLPLSPYFPQIGAGLLFLSGLWMARPVVAFKHWFITAMILMITVWWNLPLLTGHSPHCIGFVSG